MGRLDGRVVLVTGAARGTGAEIAKLFVREGAHVVAADVNDERAKGSVQDLGSQGRYQHLDITQEADWAAAVDGLQQQEGKLDILVNNAGVLHLSSIDDTSLETFETVLRVNTIGAFLGMKACLPLLRESGRGSIVNIASVNGLGGFPGVGAYTASKFALRGLTRVVALENGHFGVRANCVCPLAGNPEMHSSLVGGPPPPRPQAQPADATAPAANPLSIPLRGGKGSVDVAQAALFLASDESSFCSGIDLSVDGGMYVGTVFDIPGVFSRGPSGMSSRVLTRTALALQVGYVGLTFGWRSWLQYRRTGDSGFRLGPTTPPSARVASGLMIAGAAAGLAGTAARIRTEEPVSAIRVCGIAGIVAGLVATYQAQLDLGQSWRIGVDSEERTDLIEDGLFRYVRNPIFSFMVLVGVASFASTPSAMTAMGAAMLAAGVDVQARLVEEPYLQTTHGEAYASYARRTGRFLPRLRTRG